MPTYGNKPSPKNPLILGVFFLILLLGFGITAGCKDLRFDQNCEGHLKRAADANTVELAYTELGTALQYIKWAGLTSGNTSVFFDTPNNDIGFWFTNLSASQAELAKVTPETAMLERSNMLLKLRETLLDGQVVTVPSGITLFPNVQFYFWWGVISAIGFFTGLGVGLYRA
jgi:hypothetical protein